MASRGVIHVPWEGFSVRFRPAIVLPYCRRSLKVRLTDDRLVALFPATSPRNPVFGVQGKTASRSARYLCEADASPTAMSRSPTRNCSSNSRRCSHCKLGPRPDRGPLFAGMNFEFVRRHVRCVLFVAGSRPPSPPFQVWRVHSRWRTHGS